MLLLNNLFKEFQILLVIVSSFSYFSTFFRFLFFYFFKTNLLFCSVSPGGLGEPKYNIRGGSITAFTGSWGRPQRDGPALRSTTLINYANYLTANGNATYAKNTLLPLITADLDYVVSQFLKLYHRIY